MKQRSSVGYIEYKEVVDISISSTFLPESTFYVITIDNCQFGPPISTKAAAIDLVDWLRKVDWKDWVEYHILNENKQSN